MDSYASFKGKYPKLVGAMKCFLMFMVVYWIFSWYYSGIEKEIEEIDKDHVICQNDVNFKEFLEEH